MSRRHRQRKRTPLGELCKKLGRAARPAPHLFCGFPVRPCAADRQCEQRHGQSRAPQPHWAQGFSYAQAGGMRVGSECRGCKEDSTNALPVGAAGDQRRPLLCGRDVPRMKRRQPAKLLFPHRPLHSPPWNTSSRQHELLLHPAAARRGSGAAGAAGGGLEPPAAGAPGSKPCSAQLHRSCWRLGWPPPAGPVERSPPPRSRRRRRAAAALSSALPSNCCCLCWALFNPCRRTTAPTRRVPTGPRSAPTASWASAATNGTTT